MTRVKRVVRTVVAIAGAVSLSSPIFAIAAEGVAQGESTQQTGQQGVGLGGTRELSSGSGGSSNVLMGGPEIIMGRITNIQGEQYSIQGDRGQEVSLKVTKDTNMVCAGSKEAKFSTGQQSGKEHQEIAPTPFMEQRGGKGGQSAMNEKQMAEQHGQRGEKEGGTLSRDPSELKGKVGTTDPKANEDVAKGSGFAVGNCQFKVGDQVRVEASDMGTATTIRQLASDASSR
jgi:hypothetical protein